MAPMTGLSSIYRSKESPNTESLNTDSGLKALRPSAEGPPPTAPEIEKLIGLFLSQLGTTFPDATPPVFTMRDREIAGRWCQAGLTPDIFERIVEVQFRKMKLAGKRPPRSLGILQPDVIAKLKQLRRVAAVQPRPTAPAANAPKDPWLELHRETIATRSVGEDTTNLLSSLLTARDRRLSVAVIRKAIDDARSKAGPRDLSAAVFRCIDEQNGTKNAL